MVSTFSYLPFMQFSGVTEDDILKKIICHFKANVTCGKGYQPLKKEIAIFKQFRDCEIWLEREFSVESFSSLGYGHFIDFLERISDRISAEVCLHLAKDSSGTLFVINRKQLETFISQAQENVVDPGAVTQHLISLLLEKQFPTLHFHFIGDEADFQDLVRKQKKCSTPNCIHYATALLGNSCTGKSITSKALRANVDANVDMDADCDDHVSAKDAIECLLLVPMLSDLRSWTHWDTVFAPKFGPLLEWLSKEGREYEISCIALSDGRLIRIERSSTVDDFLEASIRCSPFHTALKLLSLLASYGGTNNIPVALLKCYSQRALDAISKGCMDSQDFVPHGNMLNCHIIQKNDTLRLTHKIGACRAARFVLDCLEHTPSEFRLFSAEILMSGLRSSTKDASAIMLHECQRNEQRIMLHGIGLSLGIVEWINDYNLFKSESSADTLSSFQGSSLIVKSVFPVFTQDTRGTSAASTIETISDNQHKISISGVDDVEMPSDNKQTIIVSGDHNTNEPHGEMVQNAAALVIESIRCEEFGLDPSSSCSDSNLLKKQHQRLGRALYCLSHELYSQDSHLLLEMVCF